MAGLLQLESQIAEAYHRGQALAASSLPAEEADRQALTEADVRRRAALSEGARRLSQRKERVLILGRLPSGSGGWLSGIMRALRYGGIECCQADPESPSLPDVLRVLEPSVVVALDSTRLIDSSSWRLLVSTTREHACVRLLIACAPRARMDDEKATLSADDQRRLELTMKGAGGHGFISQFSDAFYERLLPEWIAAGIPYCWLPTACDPAIDYPCDVTRDLDFFMVARREEDRVHVLADYMPAIFSSFFGLWAGPDWRFGVGALDRDSLRLFYSRCRIAINPLHRDLVRLPLDISERTFSAIACGAFVLTDRTPVTERFFGPDELTVVQGSREFEEAFRHYLERPEDRALFARRALRRVLAEHTYLHRAEQLLEFVASLRRLRL